MSVMKPCLPSLDLGSVEKEICDFIRREAGGRRLVLGLSGGVDSAVTAALAARAVGREGVLALLMSEEGSTLKEDMDDAAGLAAMLGIRCMRIDITGAAKAVIEAAGFRGDRVAEGNVKARIRMVFLYYVANAENRLVVGCGDRSELLTGYFTKYGDGGVDMLPIGGLYKSQVKDMARHLGLPEGIAMKASSPSLWPGHRAEDELGMDYPTIDLVLHLRVDRGYDLEGIVRELGTERRRTEVILRRIDENAHKLRPPPVARIKSGGPG